MNILAYQTKNGFGINLAILGKRFNKYLLIKY